MSNNNRRRTNNNGRGRGRRAGRKFQKRKGVEEGNLVVRINPRFPNDVKMLPIHNRVMRYNCGAQSDFAWEPVYTLRSIVSVITGSTDAYPILASIKFRRISLYSVPSTNDLGSSTQELIFRWAGIMNAPVNCITDRGTATVPACIKVVPPRDTLACMWFSADSTNETNTIFTFSCSANSILDIDFDFVIANGPLTAFTISSAGVTSGTAFWQPSSTLIPDGGVTIVHA